MPLRNASNDREGHPGEPPRESAGARPPVRRAIRLDEIEFRADAYRDVAVRRHFADRTLALENFGRFLSLLRRRTFEGQAKYLYASAGGLNPIQTYVYVKKDAVSGLREGVYYYHPVRHSLHMLADCARIPASVFCEYDRECFESAGFALFLVAQLKAIWPIYKSASSRLAVLEAGYMAQLLISRQAELNLGLCPMSGVDFDELGPYFSLDDGHMFVHGLFGGAAAEAGTRSVADDSLPAYLRRSGKGLYEHRAASAHRNAFAALLAADRPALVLPTVEDKDEAKRHPAYLREIPDDAPSIELEELLVDEAYYPLRSTKREYADEPVTLHKLSEFLSLLRPARHGASAAKLYACVSGTDALKVYVYVKDGGVDGAAPGLYRYDCAAHELVLVSATLSCDLKTCHTPFNRKQVQASKFCVFLVAASRDLEEVYGDEGQYFALLEAGYAGQLLLDRQAEFGIGVCPIGGLRFEKIRDDFGLAPRDELVHSFVCGGHELALPDDWRFLRIEPGVAAKPAGLGAGPGVRSPGRKRQGVAIVGISGRYPEAENLERFWSILRDGKSCFREIAFNDAREYRSARGSRPGAPAFRHRGGFLDEVDCFDSPLFNIPPVSAREMDPQERLVLEVVWECLENAGYTGAALARAPGKVGVFIGAMWDDYQHYSTEGWKTNRHPVASAQHASIANRISYFFDFTGPSVSLNTSCSSAMTALHYACESLRTGECKAAIVGGVNVLTHPYHYELLRSMELLSSDSKPHPFGRDGSGWVPGEGVGAVLLKPIEEAEARGDHIHGVIRGTALGHSGKSARWTSPNTRRQKESIVDALDNAGVDATSISYVEAAAPGAKLADASEMAALKQVFGATAGAERTVHVGSVKGNIGHLESASALAQLTKVLLQMKHRALCPVPDLGTLNPLLQLEESALDIVAQAQPWNCGRREQEAAAAPRRALINAFGATGSGGHVIVEEYRASAPACGDARDEAAQRAAASLLLLSAATDEQLTRLVKRFDDYLATPTSSLPRLDDIAHTLRVGRVEMTERLAVIAHSHDELREQLRAYKMGVKDIPNLFRGRAAEQPLGDVNDCGLELSAIARRWVDGTRFEWQELVRGTERRVPLPTYPFAKHSYWICADRDDVVDAAVSPARQSVRPTADYRAEQPSATPFCADALASRVEVYLKRIFAIVTEIPYETIDGRTTFDSYGISSHLITQLNAWLSRDFRALSKTLFFEYRTLEELAQYFVRERAHEVREVLERASGAPREAAKEGQPRLPVEKPRQSSARAERERAKPEMAIIGMSGVYPRAETLEAFWENLEKGVDCVSEIPEQRFDYRRYYQEDRAVAGRIASKWGGFIDGVDLFDPLFFNITPKEAELMDPQERLFLQTAWHTFEDASYGSATRRSKFDRKVGVFVGVMYAEYQLLGASDDPRSREAVVSSTYGSIANRISHFFDFSGPSLAVDTLCSSSLTALHLAVQSIERGECRAAIVGGVNLSIHPNKFIAHTQLNMPSSSGRCRSFGEGGDGFVPGEGVGAVLVKPLAAAIEDGDRVYAVIRGTAINHNGRTHGYTVPSPNAQAEMITSALEESGVDPEAISYVEAHGTGTALGDPIEISGLTKAFQARTAKTGFCAIGSVKSNIGHLEAAAGIAGLTKILLQMKHRRLVPSLHSETLSPNIDFATTPFFVQQKAAEWARPTCEAGGRRVEHPRIACISSFGACGANGHAILEEFIDDGGEADAGVGGDGAVAVVLSARSEERLRAYARKLLVFLRGRAQRGEEVRLADLGYTLQVGREAMEERLGVLVESVEELQEKLAAYIEGEEPAGLYQGQVKRNRPAMSVFTADEDLAQAIESWIGKRKLGQLLALWVKGLQVEWERLYAESKPRRMSAPTYPFAEERYWVETTGRDTSSAGVESRAQLHPLLQENTSDLKEQRFSSTFRGDEWFVAAEGGEQVLPEAVQLQMAVEAVKRSSAVYAQGDGIKLEAVVWGEPIVAGAAEPVHIGLYAREGERIAFEVYSEGAARPRVHSQGMAALIRAEQAVVDLSAVRERLEPRGAVSGVRGLEQLHAGSGEALAKLRLPVSGAGTGVPFTLPPGLLEAVLALWAELGVEGPQGVTAARLDSVEIVRACPESLSLWIRCSDARPQAHGRNLDVELCDHEGNVCARLRGLEVHFTAPPAADAAADVARETVCLRKTWSVDDDSRAAGLTVVQPASRMLILATKETQPLADSLAELSPGSTVVDVAQMDSHSVVADAAANDYRCCVDLVGCGRERKESLGWITWIQRLIERGRKDGVTLLGVTRGLERFLNPAVNLSGASRAGLYRMLQSEYAHVVSRHVDVDAALGPAELIAVIARELSMESDDCEVCYRDGKRYRAELAAIPAAGSPLRVAAFPQDRVLLITGGTRGLGYLCARHFVRCHGVKRLVLMGREPLPPRDSWRELEAAARATPDSVAPKVRAVRALEELGAEVRVLSTPLTNGAALRRDLEAIGESFGPIGGVIHCAGVVDRQDPAFIRKTPDGIAQVLEPKVAGLDNLLAQLRGQPLDFVVLFSSVSATIPTLSSGQSDYAMANAYMDYVAEARVGDVPVTSVQWPSWKDTGMGEVTSAAYRNTGLLSHSDEEGLRLLDRVLGADLGPVVLPAVVDSQRWRAEALMRRAIRARAESPAGASAARATATETAARVARPPVDAVESWLIELFSTELKIDKKQLQKDVRFEDYGVDSILLAQVTRRINEKLAQPLDPSVLYEYATIESLAAWFVENSPSSLPAQIAAQASDRLQAPKAVAISGHRRPALEPVAKSSRAEPPKSDGIAVVGMSCRFPGADDLDEYWRLLAEGRSAIARVPSRRFGASGSFYAGLVRDVSRFDPSFFMICDEDAAVMDPQALLILEESLRAFSHAGYSLAEVKGSRTGVYLGARSFNSQFDTALEKSRNPIKALGQNYLAANVSQFFDLRGPSMVVDTACSSALVGMDLALKGLLSGEIDAALVGGVSLLTSDGVHKLFQRRGLLNPHGEFHVFDQRASGVVLGEGAGVVLLKTLEQARKDRDRVYAVVKALAINNDGRTAGPATPKVAAQKEVMQAALAKSGKAPADVVYIDANGSGSEVTDLLELKAIESVYRADSTAICSLGSMKPNIGHPLTAEGIASFIKVVLMLSRGEWVPFLSAKHAMTHYDLAASPFRFCRERAPWPAGSRTAALNCFADGGTNAHVILEAYEPAAGEPPSRRAPLAPPALDKRDCYAADTADDDLPTRNWWVEDGRPRTETVVLN